MTARILIIHDQKTRQEEMWKALSAAHKVTIANNASEGIALLKEFEDVHLDRLPLDMIISCVHIEASHGLTVFDLLKWTKGNPQIKEVPFILLCSEPSSMARSLIDSVRLAGNALGATAYMIIEQFDHEKFLEQIEYYLPEELRSLSQTDDDLEEAATEATADCFANDNCNGISQGDAIDIRRARSAQMTD